MIYYNIEIFIIFKQQSHFKILISHFPRLFSINWSSTPKSLSTGADECIAVLNLMYAFFNDKGKSLGVFKNEFDKLVTHQHLYIIVRKIISCYSVPKL